MKATISFVCGVMGALISAVMFITGFILGVCAAVYFEEEDADSVKETVTRSYKHWNSDK